MSGRGPTTATWADHRFFPRATVCLQCDFPTDPASGSGCRLQPGQRPPTLTEVRNKLPEQSDIFRSDRVVAVAYHPDDNRIIPFDTCK
ncbi:MAG: hypothetical protein CMJ81_23440 [Planctomycetaceae bacterium]|nr:hypothetical protein [Planctomycetaceae bacterium]